MPRQVLSADQDTSAVFWCDGGNPGFIGDQTLVTQQLVLLTGHAGGEWTVEVQHPDDETKWVSTNVVFSEDGMLPFWASPEFNYRIDGGTRGAEAWVTRVRGVRV